MRIRPNSKVAIFTNKSYYNFHVILIHRPSHKQLHEAVQSRALKCMLDYADWKITTFSRPNGWSQLTFFQSFATFAYAPLSMMGMMDGLSQSVNLVTKNQSISTSYEHGTVVFVCCIMTFLFMYNLCSARSSRHNGNVKCIRIDSTLALNNGKCGLIHISRSRTTVLRLRTSSIPLWFVVGIFLSDWACALCVIWDFAARLCWHRHILRFEHYSVADEWMDLDQTSRKKRFCIPARRVADEDRPHRTTNNTQTHSRRDCLCVSVVFAFDIVTTIAYRLCFAFACNFILHLYAGCYFVCASRSEGVAIMQQRNTQTQTIFH